MRIQFTILLVIAAVSFGCTKQYPVTRPSNRAQAEALMAKIRPSMTLAEILRAIPHDPISPVHAIEHGGLWYDLPVSDDYIIQIRISPVQPGSTPEQSVINYSPRLRDRRTLQFIAGGEKTW
jgi:hypothetical protein